MIVCANPHAAYLERRKDILDALVRVCDSGRYILGDEVTSFERAFASFCNAEHCIGVANGTDAIELALRGLGVGQGQAVFTVSHTAVATVAAIERAGALPVLVDIDPDHGTMSADSLAKSIRYMQQARPDVQLGAVIGVHMYGHPCDVKALLEVCDAHNLPFIEDCAQAHGAKYNGQPVGSLGHVAAFSFYPTKNLGTMGDAGGVCTNDSTVAQKIQALRQYGWEERYISAYSGINSRMDPLHAAVLNVHLGYLNEDIERRRAIAAHYDAALQGSSAKAPYVASFASHAYHLYVVRTPNRQEFMEHMKAHGVDTALHYPAPVHTQSAYVQALAEGRICWESLDATDLLYKEIVSLPMYAQMSAEDVNGVCRALAAW